MLLQAFFLPILLLVSHAIGIGNSDGTFASIPDRSNIHRGFTGRLSASINSCGKPSFSSTLCSAFVPSPTPSSFPLHYEQIKRRANFPPFLAAFYVQHRSHKANIFNHDKDSNEKHRSYIQSFQHRNFRLSSSSSYQAPDMQEVATLVSIQDVNQEMQRRLLLHQQQLASLGSNETLPQSQSPKNIQPDPISIIGYVSCKRKLGRSLAFIDLIPGTSKDEDPTAASQFGKDPGKFFNSVQTLWKRQEFLLDPIATNSIKTPSMPEKTLFDAYLETVNPGTKVLLTGIPSKTRIAGEYVLNVQSCHILGLPRYDWRYVKSILDWTKFEYASANDGDAVGAVDEDENDTYVNGGNENYDRKRKRAKVGSSNLSPKWRLLPLEEISQASGLPYDEMHRLLCQTIAHPTAVTTRTATDSDEFVNASITEFKSTEQVARELIRRMPHDDSSPEVQLLQTLQSGGKNGATSSELGNRQQGQQSEEGNRRSRQQGKDRVSFTAPNEYLHPPSAIKSLRDSKSNNNIIAQTNSVVGWVTNRRRYSDSITILKIVDDFQPVGSSLNASAAFDSDSEQNTITCILHPEMVFDVGKDESGERCKIYTALLARGARAQFQGYYADSSEELGARSINTKSSVRAFWVTKVRLIQSSWYPNTIRYLLELISNNKFDPSEACDAMLLQNSEIQQLSNLKDDAERRWRSTEISTLLQGKHSRMASMDLKEDDISLLSQFASVREAFPLQTMEHPPTNSASVTEDAPSSEQSPFFAWDPNKLGSAKEPSKKKTSIDRKSKDQVGIERNLRNSATRFETRKKQQIKYMIEEIKAVIHSHPAYGHRPLHILDIGGGKGHLANAIASNFGNDVLVSVVDIDQNAIANGRRRSLRQDLDVTYWAGDASALGSATEDDLSAIGVGKNKVDVVVALHACGALSDVALGHASRFGAAFVICPCCFCSNPQLRVSIHPQPHSLSMLSANQWLDIDDSQLSNLNKLCEIQGDRALSQEAIHTLCALRSQAVLRHHPGVKSYPPQLQNLASSVTCQSPSLDVSLKTFPIGFSTRNICVVGRMQNNN